MASLWLWLWFDILSFIFLIFLHEKTSYGGTPRNSILPDIYIFYADFRGIKIFFAEFSNNTFENPLPCIKLYFPTKFDTGCCCKTLDRNPEPIPYLPTVSTRLYSLVYHSPHKDRPSSKIKSTTFYCR